MLMETAAFSYNRLVAPSCTVGLRNTPTPVFGTHGVALGRLSWAASTTVTRRRRRCESVVEATSSGGAQLPPLDLTEDNIRLVLADARDELGQIFDLSVGMTGKAELAELDGPYVKISLRGRFWHKRSTVLARLGNYLKQRIPEILEVEIEDEKQLDDSPENF